MNMTSLLFMQLICLCIIVIPSLVEPSYTSVTVYFNASPGGLISGSKCLDDEYIESTDIVCNSRTDVVHIEKITLRSYESCSYLSKAPVCEYIVRSSDILVRECEGLLGECYLYFKNITETSCNGFNFLDISYRCIPESRLKPLCPDQKKTYTAKSNLHIYTPGFIDYTDYYPPDVWCQCEAVPDSPTAAIRADVLFMELEEPSKDGVCLDWFRSDNDSMVCGSDDIINNPLVSIGEAGKPWVLEFKTNGMREYRGAWSRITTTEPNTTYSLYCQAAQYSGLDMPTTMFSTSPSYYSPKPTNKPSPSPPTKPPRSTLPPEHTTTAAASTNTALIVGVSVGVVVAVIIIVLVVVLVLCRRRASGKRLSSKNGNNSQGSYYAAYQNPASNHNLSKPSAPSTSSMSGGAKYDSPADYYAAHSYEYIQDGTVAPSEGYLVPNAGPIANQGYGKRQLPAPPSASTQYKPASVARIDSVYVEPIANSTAPNSYIASEAYLTPTLQAGAQYEVPNAEDDHLYERIPADKS